MIYFDREQQIREKDEIEELSGKLSSQEVENKLMKSPMVGKAKKNISLTN